MVKNASCVMCGSDSLRLDKSKKSVEIEGTATDVPFHIHWCESCGSEMALNEDLRFNARAMRQVRKKHYGVLTGEEVRTIRKKLGLSQDQAAKIFGGGPVAFSKYENDEITQSEAMDRLLWISGMFPFLVTLLADRHQVAITATSHAQVIIEKASVKFSEELFSLGSSMMFNDIELMKGFSKPAMASNEGIYSPGPQPKAAAWKVA